jgi:ABC-2 type transport system permease protein
MKKGNFDHSLDLVRFILRRERAVSLIWILSIVLSAMGLAAGMASQFDGASRQALAATLSNPAMIAMMGPVVGVEDFTLGAMYTTTMLLWTALAVGVMNIVFVVRHTRADEERGRLEVVRSLPVGRLSNLNAVMAAALIINTALAVLTGLGLAAAGDTSMGLGPSMLFGALLGVCGISFAAVTALFAQLSSNSRGALGLSFLAMGVFYMLRAAGDMERSAVSLFSPLGLILRAEAYAENFWWPVWVLLGLSAVIAAAAYKLNAIRDIDRGFIAEKPGRKEAPKSLRTSFGLSLRLLKTPLIIWAALMFSLGASYGTVLADIEAFIEETPFYAQLMYGPFIDASELSALEPGSEAFAAELDRQIKLGMEERPPATMFATMVNAIMALVCLVPMLMFALKLRGEEKDGRSEHILTRSVSRCKYLAGFTAIAFASSVILQLATPLGLYPVALSVLSGPGDLRLGLLLQANLVYLPALWVMIGLAVLLTGLLPKLTGLLWGFYGLLFIVTLMGRIPGVLPEWFNKLSPFSYVPQLPVDEINYAALATLTVIAAVLTALGFLFYRKRDMLPG